jgi:Ca2+-binding RTX toxin-like protein
MNGANGFDTLTGGFGRDTMAGGLHRDIFDFNSAAESGTVAFTRDVITDFQKGVDDIDLSTIDAKSGAGNQAFTFIGQAAFSGAKGQLHIKFAGPHTIVEGDIDGNKVADFSIQLNGHKVLTAGDSIL